MALNFSEWQFHKIGWFRAEGFIDFYSKRKRVGGGNVKSLELREMPRHLLGRQVKSVKKSELGQSCSEDKWVCRQNGSSSAGRGARVCSRLEENRWKSAPSVTAAPA